MKNRNNATRIIALSAVLITPLLLITFAATAQRMVSGGRALDANLKMNSGGYNRAAPASRAPLGRQRYSIGSTRPVFRVNSQTGTVMHNPHNAFNPHGRYNATGYVSNFGTNAWHSRFRYY